MPEAPPDPAGLRPMPGSSRDMGAPTGSEGGREFLQARLLFFSKMGVILLLGYFVAENLLAVFFAGRSWARVLTAPLNLGVLASAAFEAGAFAVLSRSELSLRSLRAIDAAAAVLLSLFYALAGLFDPEPKLLLAAILGTTNTLLARAVVIPSSAARTLWIGGVASVPTVVAEYLLALRVGPEGSSALHQAGVFLLWCSVAVTVATVASQVIFGLRKEVREARRLGQYTLEERIGAGGMGEVYRARHAMLRRPTAVKLLRREKAGDAAIVRFEREVQLTSRLTHPNTIAIFDYGRTPDGTFYYAMEFLPGVDLEALVRREGPQSPGRVISILRQVCGALTEAHSLGLIHRDIKAANVILCERGGLPDVAKVVDFGLVRDLEQGTEELTGVNVITGTPLYLSPEAISSPGDMDARSDIYSVGVLAYYLLTGKHPFEGGGFVDICSRHLHKTPAPPSGLGRPVPADLEALVLGCLEKDRARRPQTAEDLARSLARCAAAGDWTDVEARAWWRAFEERKTKAAAAASSIAGAVTAPLAMQTAIVEPVRNAREAVT